jgi:hypothetical protein
VRTLVVSRRSAVAGSLGLDGLAREARVHPELVRRLVARGLLDTDDDGRFPPATVPRLARATRLRRDLGLDYAGALLACDLLERIEQLEERLRRYEPAND